MSKEIWLPEHTRASMAQENEASGQDLTVMAFGDTESAVGATSIADYLGTFYDGALDFYTPPISLTGLGQLLQANGVHGTLPFATANWVAKNFEKNSLLSRQHLKNFVVDFRTMGNGYILLQKNIAGAVVGLQHLAAINMRARPGGGFRLLQNNGKFIDYDAEQVWHLKDYDPLQQIYGIPYWFGSLNAILLGEETDLFPLKFFRNGAHTGNLYTTSDMLPQEEKLFKEILAGTKGPGNFRSIHVGGMSGDVDKKLKVIPIGEVGQKVEFTRLSEASDKRVLSAWRYRPELAGIMPGKVEGTGDLAKIIELHMDYEIFPFQQDIMEINELLPASNRLIFKEEIKDISVE